MQLIDEQYTVKGLPALDLAAQFGTPLYVYDADRIARQITSLQTAFGGLSLKIKYAAKALTNVSVLKFMQSRGICLDAVSIQEAELGLLAGFAPADITFTPNGVAFAEIERAVALGLTINVDNLPTLAQFGQTYGATVPCCVRINPLVAAGGNYKIQTAHADSKFGISVLQKADILATVRRYGIRVNGLHQHTGSDIGDATAFHRVAQIVFDLAADFPDLDFIDLGGGFKVAYQEGDAVTDIPALGQAITASFRDFCRHYGRPLDLWLEPGKYLVSESGTLLTTAHVVKPTPARTFACVDTGLNHLLRPMLYDAYHDIVNVSNPGGEASVYTVVGNICETDTLGWDRTLPQVRPGDVLALKNAGAYGFSMSSQYNARFRPAEVLVYQGQAHLIRHRETMDDLLRNQVILDFEPAEATHP